MLPLIASAAASVLSSAMASDNTPMASGSGSFNLGGLTVGAKVIGRNNTAGATTSTSLPATTPGTAAALTASPAAASPLIPALLAGLAGFLIVRLVRRRTT